MQEGVLDTNLRSRLRPVVRTLDTRDTSLRNIRTKQACQANVSWPVPECELEIVDSDSFPALVYSLIVYLVVETGLAVATVSFFKREPSFSATYHRLKTQESDPSSSVIALALPRSTARYIGVEGCIMSIKEGVSNRLLLVLNIVPALYDTAIVIAIAYRHFKITRRVGTQLPILNRLLFDGVCFFLVITAAHITTAVMFNREPFIDQAPLREENAS